MTETTAGVAFPDGIAGTVPGSVGRVAPEHGAGRRRPGHRRPARPGRARRAPRARPAGDGGLPRSPGGDRAAHAPDGWLRTGDLGHVDADGNVFVADRLKELIKVDALQVAPAELEALLLEHPGVADAAVVPRADERHGQVPVAVVVPSGPLDDDALLAWAAARVAPHKRIRAIRRVEAIPRTPGGKIRRRTLAG